MSVIKLPSFRQIFLTLGWLSILTLAGCAGSPSLFAPASPNATVISDLTVVIFVIAGVVFVVVEGLLLYSAVRFSRRAQVGEPQQIEGNTKFEIAWTLAPAIVLAIVFVVSLQALTQIAYLPSTVASTAATGAAPLRVKVTGHQWWWQFEYPDLNIDTANDLHVPAGALVSFDLESVDVIHSFWVPQLAGKTDVIPGHTNHTWFQPTQAGTYHGQCAEFCGIEHALMRFEVIVDQPADFQAWVKAQQTPVATMTGDAAKGEKLFLNGACIGCHTVNGTKAQGKVGPNLTHLASRQRFAGASFELTPDNLKKWLANPPALKPGTLMPNLNLSPADIDALVAYLTSLK
ncbi:MAG: cytochrome c oxidase subunit II [Chloroflexota bacterium]|nr:cytochrome c oxidase subunit II [Chloroflexota bacterium]